MTKGNTYAIHTVGAIYVGCVEELDLVHNQVVLTNASWIAHAGNVHEFQHGGKITNSIPLDPEETRINLGVIVHATLWRHELPTEAIGE